MGHNLGNNYGKMYGFQSKPVILDAQFTVDNTNAAGVSSISGQGIQAVYMNCATTPSAANPNPAAGYALIKLAYNYRQCFMGPWMAQPPVTGAEKAINASALTAGVPYQISTVGVMTANTVTIAPVADSSGSLASTWFDLFDSYGNVFRFYFIVSGVGTAPSSAGVTLVPINIVTGDTAATIGALLTTQIAALPSGISGVFSFTAAGTTTVTATSTSTLSQIAGPPKEGTIATGFTFARVIFRDNTFCWQQVGLPKGVVPALGVSFIGTATGFSTAGSSSGKVKLLTTSGVLSCEVLGNTNLSIGPIPMGGSPNVGGWVLVQFLDAAGAVAAPTAGTKLFFQLLLEQATPVGGNNE